MIQKGTYMEEELIPAERSKKIPVKTIIITILAGILAFFIVSHDAETLTASEKRIIFFCPVLLVILFGVKPFLSEWIQMDSVRNSETFFKHGLAELWTLATSVVLLATILFGTRFAINFGIEKYLASENKTISASDILPKAWLVGKSPATIIGCISSNIDAFESDDLNNMPMDKTTTAHELRFFFHMPSDNPTIQNICEKIANFLNTEVKYTATRFYWKWHSILSLFAILFCVNIGTCRPFTKLYYLFKKLIPNAMAAVTGLYILIFPPVALGAAFGIAAILGVPLCLLGIICGGLLPLIAVLNLLIGILLTIFEKITSSKAE